MLFSILQLERDGCMMDGKGLSLFQTFKLSLLLFVLFLIKCVCVADVYVFVRVHVQMLV